MTVSTVLVPTEERVRIRSMISAVRALLDSVGRIVVRMWTSVKQTHVSTVLHVRIRSMIMNVTACRASMVKTVSLWVVDLDLDQPLCPHAHQIWTWDLTKGIWMDEFLQVKMRMSLR